MYSKESGNSISYKFIFTLLFTVAVLLAGLFITKSINKSQLNQIVLREKPQIHIVIHFNERNILNNYNIKSISKKDLNYFLPPSVKELAHKSVYLSWNENDTLYLYETNLIGQKDSLIYTVFEDKVLYANSSFFNVDSKIKSNEPDLIYFILFSIFLLFIAFIQLLVYAKFKNAFGEKAVKNHERFGFINTLIVIISLIITLTLFSIYLPMLFTFIHKESINLNFSLSIINSAWFPDPYLLILFITILYIYNILFLSFVNRLSQEFNCLKLAEFSPAKNSINQVFDLDIIKIEILKTISKYVNIGKYDKRDILILLGYRTVTQFFKYKNKKGNASDFSNHNRSLLNEINSLITGGYLDIVNNEFVLTRSGKEKIELPSILFLSNLPTKFDFELSRANKALISGEIEESIKILSTNILEAFTSWTITKICDEEKLQTLVNKYVNSKEKILVNATLGQLVEIFKVLLDEMKHSKKLDHINKITYLLSACINILEASKVYRNEYSHQRDITEYTSQNAIEDAYNLIQLSRMYMMLVCKYIVP